MAETVHHQMDSPKVNPIEQSHTNLKNRLEGTNLIHSRLKRNSGKDKILQDPISNQFAIKMSKPP
jgi:hypothetical protein